MKVFRKVFYALIAVAMALIVGGAVREHGWRAVLSIAADGLPIVGVIALLIGFLALMNRREARMQKRFYRHGTRATGTIVRVDRPAKRRAAPACEVIAEFTVDGATYRATSGRLSRPPGKGVGDAVAVYYNPQNPEDSCILDGDLG